MDSFLSNWLELMMHEGKPISRKIYKICPKCQLSWDEFRKTGKVGCAECYKSFQPEILSVAVSFVPNPLKPLFYIPELNDRKREYASQCGHDECR